MIICVYTKYVFIYVEYSDARIRTTEDEFAVMNYSYPLLSVSVGLLASAPHQSS